MISIFRFYLKHLFSIITCYCIPCIHWPAVLCDNRTLRRRRRKGGGGTLCLSHKTLSRRHQIRKKSYIFKRTHVVVGSSVGIPRVSLCMLFLRLNFCWRNDADLGLSQDDQARSKLLFSLPQLGFRPAGIMLSDLWEYLPCLKYVYIMCLKLLLCI